MGSGSVLLCRRQLAEVAEFVADKDLRREAQKRVQLLDPRRRKALQEWARAELAKLESRPGSGLSKVVRTKELHQIGRWMVVLQAALVA
jgi:hypothetical protein